MGYTHYFSYDPDARSFVDAWPRMVRDARLIAWYVQRSLHIPLAGGPRGEPPELTERRICLSGPPAHALQHEAFLIDPTPDEPGLVVDFCKTARKPYDVAVTSILLRCRHLAPDTFLIASDGDWRYEWQHGSMYWSHGCRRDISPVKVVRTLFGQVEMPGRSRLVLDLYDGASFPRIRPSRRR